MNTMAQVVDFLGADLPAKSTLVDRLAQSWDLAPSGSPEPPKVIEQHVAIAEVRLRLPLLIFFFLFFFLFILIDEVSISFNFKKSIVRLRKRGKILKYAKIS